jgi:ubiquinone biosynthesis protein COQ4
MSASSILDASSERSGATRPARVRPIAALLAITRLLRDPQDTKQVFLLTEALRGRSGVKPFRRFCESPVGRVVITERRSLLATLSDHDALAAMPDGSLGRHYLDFMSQENLSAEGLVEVAGDNIRTFSSPDEAVKIFAARMRDMHDLYHVLTGYGRDELGEVCVLAFSYQQQNIRSFRVIAGFGMLHIWRALRKAGINPRGVMASVGEAARNGRRAAWLPGEDLEGLLQENIDAVRVQVGIREPAKYIQLTERLRREVGAGSGSLIAILGDRASRKIRRKGR